MKNAADEYVSGEDPAETMALEEALVASPPYSAAGKTLHTMMRSFMALSKGPQQLVQGEHALPDVHGLDLARKINLLVTTI